jgi:DNA-directed RNA polymerase specialized sigma24 family protein
MMRKRKVRADYQEEIIANISVPDDEQFIDEICTKLDCADVTEAMDSLDNKYRDVLYYHFVLGLTIPETAKILDRKANTVQKQLVRGKSILLNKIAYKGGIKNADE